MSPETIAALGRAEARKDRWRTVAIWVIAATFIGILWAVRQLMKRKLMGFIRDWLVNHFLKVDRALARDLASRGVA